ncbi:MAG: hypothetical protein IT342_10585 [Candidatus Melainabacteria bacterium]|nr:hypothetical protein [Candidatus Melainabacteria bacterium]
MRKTIRALYSQEEYVHENLGQVINIEVVDEEVDYDSDWGMPTTQTKKPPEKRIFSTLESIVQKTNGFISASMLAMKAKSFDDGLYASVDIMAHEGVSTFAGKRHLVAEVVKRALARNAADTSAGLQILAAAAQKGGSQINLPPALQNHVEGMIASFDSSFMSKPLGFYAWTRELVSVFQHDRLLQQKTEDEKFLSVISVLKNSNELKQAYFAYLNLISRLTNPLTNVGLATALSSPEWTPRNDSLSFFPTSRSHETSLMESAFKGDEKVEGSLIDELLKRVKTGQLQLKPTEQSGWYDWQLYALEPLAILDRMPEAKHLHASAKYKKRLDDLFKGLYALTRETHVKQLSMMVGSAPPRLTLTPELRVEPLPSFYLRRASSYAFIRFTLEKIFSSAELSSVKRISPESEPTMNLWQEMAYMEDLFLGAHAIACDDLGMAPFSDMVGVDAARLEPARKVFREWALYPHGDPDVSRDARMMVPVSVDVLGRVQVWCFLGWSTMKLVANFDAGNFGRLLSVKPDGTEGVVDSSGCKLYGASYYAAYPIMAEIWISQSNVMIRSDFRAFCDRFTSEKEIMENLTA